MRPTRPPKRWLDDPMSATPLERDLLRTGLDDEPPPEAKAAVWAALVPQFPPPGGAPGVAAKAASAKAAAGAGGAGAAGAIGGGLLKSALIGAGSAAALIAAYSVITPSKSEAPRPPPSAVIADAPGAVVTGARSTGASAPRPIDSGKTLDPDVRPDLPLPSAGAPSPAAIPSGSAAAPQASGGSAAEPSRPEDFTAHGAATIGSEPPVAGDRQSQLLEESRRLTEARGALRSGDANATIAALRDLDRQFPGGGLGQEREALMIEALAASGRRAEAKARAEAFLKAYPSSPHATRVQAYTK